MTHPSVGAPPPGPTTTYPFRPELPIRTGRLVLRPWRPDDDDDRAAYRLLMGDPDVVRFLYDEALPPEEADRQLGDRSAAITEPGGWMNLAVEASGRNVPTGPVVIGDVGLAWTGDDHRQAELGYKFLPGHRGHGYATEAAAALVDVAFSTIGAHRVCGRLDARNAASARLLERLGMRREAHLAQNEWVKGEWTDEVVYAVLAPEWAARHTAS